MKLLEATHMNWNLRGQDSWDRTEYTVHDDGRVDWVVYTGVDPQQSTSFVSRLTPETLARLRGLLQAFGAHEPGDPWTACDGDGWRMTAWAADGRRLFRYEGYICGEKLLTEVAACLPK